MPNVRDWIGSMSSSEESEKLCAFAISKDEEGYLSYLEELSKKYEKIRDKRNQSINQATESHLIALLDEHPDHNLVVVGHNTRFKNWIRSQGIEKPKGMSREFCWLYEFEYEDGIFKPVKFTRNSEME